jgi:hypothetical protein
MAYQEGDRSPRRALDEIFDAYLTHTLREALVHRDG